MGDYMNTKIRKHLLKIVELAGLFSYIYPIILVLRNLIFDASRHALNFSLFFFSVVFGYLITRLLIRKEKTFIRQFAAYLTVIVPAGVVLIINFHYFGVFKTIYGSLQTIFETVSMILVYILSVRCGILTEDYETFRRSRIYAGFFFMVACQIATYYFDMTRQVWYQVTVFTSIYIICSLVVLNQSNLDYNIYVRRGIDTHGEQKKLRSYNIKTTLILILITLLLFNLKNVIILILKAGGKLIVYVFSFIHWLMNLIYPEDSMGGPPQQGGESGLLMPEDAGSPVWNYIFYILLGLIFLFILYKCLPAAVRGIKRLGVRIVRRLKAFINSLFDYNAIQDSSLHEEFTDEIEYIKPEGSSAVKRKSSLRKVKLRKVNDPVEKVRLLYGTVLKRLSEKVLEIKPSQTAREILSETAKAGFPGESLEKVTGIYEDVRYGMKVPDPDEITVMEKHCRIITENTR